MAILSARYSNGQTTAEVSREVAQLEALLPTGASVFAEFSTTQVDEAAQRAERACALLAEAAFVPGESPLPAAESLLQAKLRVDACLERMLNMRVSFAALDKGSQRDDAARAYLRTVSRLIDLSGRLRYLLYDALDAAAAVAVEKPEWRAGLIDSARTSHSVAAGNAWSVALFAEAGQGGPSAIAASDVLAVMRSAPDPSHLQPVVEYLDDPRRTPREVLQAVETIAAIGIPQDVESVPGEVPPAPVTTAARLHARLAEIDRKKLDSTEQERRSRLLELLDATSKRGVVEAEYCSAGIRVRPGDWILMRNPSPYNHFSSLSPGLFTHVGVITDVTGADGKRRFVVVDLPEKGSTMPATNYDAFVLQTLHYVVMRHPDQAVAGKMAEVARTLIGSPTEFDLHFDTSIATALKGKIAPGVKVKSYCAGLLLVCAQETSAARETLFPFSETVAGGNTAKNLATLGLAIQDDFISPTGPMFSPQLQLVGRREALYEPTREIREAVYDYFAEGLANKTLTSTPNLQQSLRIRLAEMGKQNRLLGDALAKANGVSVDLDLVSAAKAAAVVETLDEVAVGAAQEFSAVWNAMLSGDRQELRDQGLSRDEIATIERHRRQHDALYQQWVTGELPPRVLREELVKYYVAAGKEQLDARFFTASPSQAPTRPRGRGGRRGIGVGGR